MRMLNENAIFQFSLMSRLSFSSYLNRLNWTTSVSGRDFITTLKTYIDPRVVYDMLTFLLFDGLLFELTVVALELVGVAHEFLATHFSDAVIERGVLLEV